MWVALTAFELPSIRYFIFRSENSNNRFNDGFCCRNIHLADECFENEHGNTIVNDDARLELDRKLPIY